MTANRSLSEWNALFDQTERDLSASTSLSGDTQIPPPTALRDTIITPFRPAILAGCIDHTLLKLDATEAQINGLCDDATRLEFRSVCLRLPWVERAVQRLQGGSVVVACVIGFHEGTYSTAVKVREAREAIVAGAKELDMVMNHHWLREGRYSDVFEDIAAVRGASPHPVLLKVIIETAVLSRKQIVAACKIAEAAQADFVKTSTGFNGPGASVSNVRLMRNVVRSGVNVKASGGIRTLHDCLEMLNAGAARLGTSGGVEIMKEAAANDGFPDRENVEPIDSRSRSDGTDY